MDLRDRFTGHKATRLLQALGHSDDDYSNGVGVSSGGRDGTCAALRRFMYSAPWALSTTTHTCALSKSDGPITKSAVAWLLINGM